MEQSTISNIKQWIALDSVQFEELLKQLDKPDALGIFSQILIAIVAAYSGYYFQKRFKKSDEIASQKAGIYRFNEAVTYIGVFLENITTTLEQLVLKSLTNEEREYNRLSVMMENMQRGLATGMQHSFISIPAIEIARPEQLISGIPNNGKYIELNLAFHRMRNGMSQFAAISEERNLLIKQFISNFSQPMDREEIIYLRFGEILDRTQKLLLSGEIILDAAMFIAQHLEEIAKNIREDFKILSKEKIVVAGIGTNELHEQLRKDIRKLLDGHPKFQNRHLHFSSDTMPE